MLPNLSFDIQVEIIKKLPVKSLIQFRSVCKGWKSLIDSSHFIAGYNVRRDQYAVGFGQGFGQEEEVKYVSFVDDDDTFPQQKFALTVPPLLQAKATGSSHGLLCFTGYHRGPDDSGKTQMVILWNPAIRKSVAVAVPNGVNRPFNYIVGFGVCPHTKDPKLVRITYIHEYWKIESISCIPYQVMVFTLSSGEWTCLSSNNLPRTSIQFTCCQTVIGQFIYWLAFDWIAVDGGEYRYRSLIMSFDMSTQEFKEIVLPDSLAEMCEVEDLSVYRLRESLAVVEYNSVSYGTHLWKRVCSVWMMEHGDFTKLFTVNLPNASVSQTLGFTKSGKPILDLHGDDKPCALVFYEPCSEHIKDLGICRNKCPFFGSSYMESLLLLDYDDGHIVKCGAVKR